MEKLIDVDSMEKCPLRHENGNCWYVGGFCTAVNDSICHGLRSAYNRGMIDCKDGSRSVMDKILHLLEERLDEGSVLGFQYIQQNLTRRELLEQLAEEATELGKAALKCIRAEGLSNNPTQITKENAIDNLLEELYDILDVCAALGTGDDAEKSARQPGQKWCRWEGRVREKFEQDLQKNVADMTGYPGKMSQEGDDEE